MLNIIDKVALSERDKYDAIWQHDVYKEVSPGMDCVEHFMRIMSPTKGDTLIDIGCGEGIAGLEFQQRGLRVWWLDITDAALREDVNRKWFLHMPVWSREFNRRKFPTPIDFGFCCDVLEHVPTEYVMLAVHRIISVCSRAWLQVAFLPETHGRMIGKTLHMTVRPYSWWLEHIGAVCKIDEARDICGRGVFMVSR
jgi:2-polyprenyl-3-methyl-5-hydroxy-6-metoxy-1,4-benzoquinol methylase